MTRHGTAHEDELILVDLFDRPVGHAPKLACHEQGRLHRAFSVFLVNGREVLLQRRAEGKYHSGGLWTNSCCSHPRVGEELGEAVARRLYEELGVDGCACREVGSFVYRHEFENGLVEFEYDHVFVGEWAGAVAPDPTEASAVAWVGIDEVASRLEREPDAFTCWFMTAAPMAFAAI